MTDPVDPVTGREPAASAEEQNRLRLLNIKPAIVGSAAPLDPGVRAAAEKAGVSFATPESPLQTQKQSVTAQQVKQTDKQLPNLAQFDSNPLIGYQQHTYHFRLYMTQDIELFGEAGKANLNTNPLAAFDSAPKRIIAETGKTGFSINDVQIESVCGPNFRTRNTDAKKITITISAPTGTTLMDKIVEAADDLSIFNYAKAFYYLELSFYGYDENGTSSTNLCQDFPNGGKWLWQFLINDMETTLDATGSKYVLTCVPYNESVMEPDMWLVPATCNVEARKVGELFDKLAQAINQSVFDRYAGFNLYTYAFKIHPVMGQDRAATGDPSSWDIVVDPQINNRRSAPLAAGDNNVTKGHFQKGMSISDIVDHVFAATQYGQELAKALPVQDKVDDKDGKDGRSTLEKLRDVIVFRIEPEVSIGKFDQYTQLYQKQIVLHIFPYLTFIPILSKQQMDDAKDQGVQQLMIQKMQENGFLKKWYEYLYTGHNTEVLSLDLKYNVKWSAVLPYFLGLNHYDQYSVNDKANERTKNYDPFAEYTYYKNKLDALVAEQQRIREVVQRVASGQGTETDKTYVENTRQRLIDISHEQMAVAKQVQDRQEAAQAFRMNSPEPAALSQDKMKDIFVEDLPTLEQSSKLPLELSIIQGTYDPENILKGPFPNQQTSDKSLYATILDQLYAPMSQQLININLEVRGDPYWIGPATIDRRTQLARLSEAEKSGQQGDFRFPNFQNGDNCFLLTFRYPKYLDQFGDPAFGDTPIRRNAFDGIYAVRGITNNFSGGLFKQTLNAYRIPLADVFKGFGVNVIDSNNKS